MAVVGAAAPRRRALLQLVERAVDLGLLALLPGGVPLLLRAEALLVNQQQRRIEHAVGGASLAAMTFMLAAHGMGLATLPMIGFDPEGVRKYLDVPNDYVITMLIAVGYSANKELPRQQRRGLHDIVNWDRFGQKSA